MKYVRHLLSFGCIQNYLLFKFLGINQRGGKKKTNVPSGSDFMGFQNIVSGNFLQEINEPAFSTVH